MSLRLPFVLVPVVCASAACAADAADSDAPDVTIREHLEPRETKEAPPAPKDGGTTWKLGNKVWTDDWLAPK
ncbi:MAG TPA: hypothetical protein VM925_37245 [Labilithrix sp.]|nr:hypothetical protein [Labilithrix sp.]